MKVVTKTFWLPKRGNSNEEYEDAAWPLEPTELECDEFKCAVSDGATEASFSARWAQLLVQGFSEQAELKDLADKWSAEIKDLDLPWYAQEKAESGAFATLTALKITSPGTTGGTWWSKAIGDSCFLHIRDESLLESFPMTDAESFNNSPLLLCSNLGKHEEVDRLFLEKEGTWLNGDRFLLLTDAIAAWFFRKHDKSGDALKTLLNINDQNELLELVNKARNDHDEEGRPYMRNDDVTLVRVEVST
ncbi:MAG: protein phosphatase 2C domain-containing protein [Candidatus Obscuribacterales bacterium]|nr:protein phosphatase 2C domain-containing protein [Candidatus Obscuribacterales bacterium]